MERAQIGNSYEALLNSCVGLRFRETAAAKTLHALRPDTLPMWDAAIKNWFIDENAISKQTASQTYSNFLRYVAEEISALEAEVIGLGHCLADVPHLVQGPHLVDGDRSLVKLVDEFHWITITGKHVVPTRDVLEQWLRWIIK